MAASTTDIYRSENGDRWQLVQDTGGRYWVRHEPNLSSGGRATDTDLAAFLDRSGTSPQAVALRTVLERDGISQGKS